MVMGLGGYREGSGTMATLYFAQAGAKEVLVTDLKSEKELQLQVERLRRFPNVRFVLGGHRAEDFRKADVVFQNPSVPDSSPYLSIARKRDIPIINDWNIFLQAADNFLIGVTGTRGKSTTAALVFEMLKQTGRRAVFCGNIGVSPLKYLGRLTENTVVVAELSSWLLRGFRTGKKSPNIAVLTNLLVDHQDKYGSLEEYYRDKDNIFAFQKKDDFLIANRDSAAVRRRIKKAKSKIVWFSLKPFPSGEGSYVKNGKVYLRLGDEEKLVVPIAAIKLKGQANLSNVLAAVAAAGVYSLPVAAMKKVLRSFRGLPSRLEPVGFFAGIRFYNDTTSTTPDAAVAALRALGGKRKKIVLLAGGYDKKLDFREMAKEIKKSVKAVVLFRGTASDKIENELRKAKVGFEEAGSMKEAVRLAMSRVKKGEIVLLSPGAASFGMFENEYDRGSQFNRQVKYWEKKYGARFEKN